VLRENGIVVKIKDHLREAVREKRAKKPPVLRSSTHRGSALPADPPRAPERLDLIDVYLECRTRQPAHKHAESPAIAWFWVCSSHV